MMELSNNTFAETLASDEGYGSATSSWDVLKAALCLLCGLANILIIYVIARNSALQTRPNAYLANWCISSCIILILSSTQLGLFGSTEDISYELLCVTEESHYGMIIPNLLFVLVLFLEWYSGSYGRPCCLTSRLGLVAIVALIWTVALIISAASATFCILDMSYPLSLISFNLVYISVFVVIIFVHVLRIIMIKIFNKPPVKNKLELVLVTSYFFCWLPNFLLIYGQMFFGFSVSPTLELVTYFCGYAHSFVMLILLYFCDKCFKMHLRDLFGLTEKTPQSILHKEQNTGLL
ncbi:hypothetical protein YQE_04360, partial [Dendroctonus ponderosae]